MDFLLIQRIPGKKLSEMTPGELLRSDAKIARQLVARLMQIVDVGGSFMGLKSDDLALDDQGRLVISDVRGVVLGHASETDDPIHFAANELLPRGMDSESHQACVDAMESEVRQIKSGQLAT